MKIKKAIIPTAGYGTRFFPITKTIQKEMLPILNRPIIDHIVRDAVLGGIEEIIFVTNESNTQVKDYYSDNLHLQQYLTKRKQLDKYPHLDDLYRQIKFTFIHQSVDSVYGTATPVKLAQKYVEHEDAFIVFMGDDFIYHSDGNSETKKMIDYFLTTAADGLATFTSKPLSEISKYGVANYDTALGYPRLLSIVEKPSSDKAPSNLANISKYILKPVIFDILAHQQVDPIHQELLFTDTISQLIATKKPVALYQTTGQYLDGGNISGWLKANLTVAFNDPSLKKELSDFLKTLI